MVPTRLCMVLVKHISDDAEHTLCIQEEIAGLASKAKWCGISRAVLSHDSSRSYARRPQISQDCAPRRLCLMLTYCICIPNIPSTFLSAQVKIELRLFIYHRPMMGKFELHPGKQARSSLGSM